MIPVSPVIFHRTHLCVTPGGKAQCVGIETGLSVAPHHGGAAGLHSHSTCSRELVRCVGGNTVGVWWESSLARKQALCRLASWPPLRVAELPCEANPVQLPFKISSQGVCRVLDGLLPLGLGWGSALENCSLP